MTRHNIVHVALDPPEMFEASLIKQVAVILNKDAYESRLLLSGKIPQVIAHFDTGEGAQSIVKALKSLGLAAVALNDSELHKTPTSTMEFATYNINLGEGEVRFSAKNGAIKTINTKDMFLILYGKMRIPIITKGTRSKMKLSVPATLMTGGIPIWRKSEEGVEDISFQTEYFVRLYGWLTPEPKIEVFESKFNYDFLGARITPSSSTNLRMLVLELKKMFPKAVFDARLTEYSPAMQEDEIETVCKLIYLCHRARLNIS
jgi:hypothetical protein